MDSHYWLIKKLINYDNFISFILADMISQEQINLLIKQIIVKEKKDEFNFYYKSASYSF